MVIGSLFLLLAAYLAYIKASDPSDEKKRFDPIYAFFVFGLFVVGLWLTRLSPFIAVIGGAIFAATYFKFVPESKEGFLRRIGITALLAALLVLGTKQFLSPYSGDWRREERTDWQPPMPEKIFKPSELLQKKWSSSDKYADWPVAKLMLDLSRISYLDPVDAGESLKRLGFQWESISDGSMNGYVASIDDTAVVVFRGTEDGIGDLLQDMQFFKRTNDHGRIHGGFDRGYLGMHAQVEKLLKRFNSKRVWLTGHSLGGALSIVCAYHLLQLEEIEIAGVMTYGQPMVVRQELADFLQSKLKDRYVFFVNDMDPIVKIVEPYVHFGHMVQDKDGVIFRVNSQYRADAETKEKAGKVSSRANELESMSDPSLDQLINRIEESNRPKFNEKGELLVEGYLPDIYDHYLDSYDAMISRLVHGGVVAR